MPAAVLGGGIPGTAVQNRKARKAQQKAAKIDQKRQDFTIAREKRKQIRQARAAQAQIQASAFAQGTAQTSRTSSITGNISSEVSQNLSFLDSSRGFTQAIGQQNLITSKAQAKAQQIQAVQKLVQAGMGVPS